MVYIFSIFSHDVTTDVAYDLKHAVIIVDCILIVLRSIIIFIGLCKITLFECHDLLHHRMGKIEFQGRVVSIEISHCMSAAYLEFFL